MKEMLKKMMEKKKDGMLPENEKGAKLSILKELMKQADEKMFEPVKKVSVVAKDKQGLEMGLDRAKQILDDEMDTNEAQGFEDISPEEASLESDGLAEKLELLKKLRNK